MAAFAHIRSKVAHSGRRVSKTWLGAVLFTLRILSPARQCEHDDQPRDSNGTKTRQGAKRFAKISTAFDRHVKGSLALVTAPYPDEPVVSIPSAHRGCGGRYGVARSGPASLPVQLSG